MAKKKEVDLEEEVTEEIIEEPEEEVIEKPKTSQKVKAKVVRAYSDKNDGTVHRPGEVVEVTQKRFDEINSKKTHLKNA